MGLSDFSFDIRLKSLCDRQGYLDLIKEICIVDKMYENDQFGWQFKDVRGLSGAHVNILMQEGIIKYGYKSANATYFKLSVDRGVIEQALRDSDKHKTEIVDVCTSIEPDAIDEFEKMLAGGTDMVEYWSKCINPKIEGLELVKKALLLSVASSGDRYGDRGRIHVLMYGDPGSAKSQLMSWVVYQLGAHFCSQRTSKVGLTADASGNDLTPGALPRANGGILCCDELDKFNHADRQGMLEAMEEGKVHIEVGKISATLDAEVRVIAAANKIDDFSPELLDRYDFKFELRAPTGEGQKKVTCSIVKNWFREKPGYNGMELKSYLTWIKDFNPGISDAVSAASSNLLCMYLDLDDYMKGSPRKTESVMRIAYTIAKLHSRDLEIGDLISAIKISNPMMNGGKIQALERVAGLS